MPWESFVSPDGSALLINDIHRAACSGQIAANEAALARPFPLSQATGCRASRTRSSSFSCRGQPYTQQSNQTRVRWQLRRASCFASISGAGPLAASDTASEEKHLAVEGPGNALRLHAEELKAAAEERAQREADVSRQERRQRHRKLQQERQQRLWYEGVNHVKHMAAGALAACVSRTVVAPFERVKMECILRQRGVAAGTVAAGILRSGGVRGFWQGNLLNVMRTAPYKVPHRASEKSVS